ncbi:MAG TPA: tRNA epoxyqueuosine(34) reductase QueG [Bryobacteraceae bacterium]|nr:tRNA epoxyqueuosine(34) reductase QueG [Bryobacteraceae bacterium]
MARACGFELAGVARAEASEDRERYHNWVRGGYAGEMRYLTDRRADVRDDPRNLLASACSVICVGKLYNTPHVEADVPEAGWISRYAWGDDYHDEMRRGLQQLDALIREGAGQPVESKICVDTAPLLERSYARAAGLGWIGKNTCLINQQSGSWFFLGELLVSISIEPDKPPPDRCGTCTRCIDACPTAAIVKNGSGYGIDSRLCISYFTIELRGPVPEQLRGPIGHHVFGCDICQDVCPWNRSAPVTSDPAYQPRHYAPPLAALADVTEQEFREMFRKTPVSRARYAGFLRNVAIAMGNAGSEKFRGPLEKLAGSSYPLVAEHARWGIAQLDRATRTAQCEPRA